MSFLFKCKILLAKIALLLSGIFMILFLSGWVNFDGSLLKDSNETQNTYSTVTVVEKISSPSMPPAAPPTGEGDNGEGPQPEMEDVINNGDFEKRWQPLNGVAPDWKPFSNGQADFGWYEEAWAEAVRKGQGHAQLMEIFRVEANILDRVIAIYQTVDVVPDSEYELTIHAIMRSDAAAVFRNQNEFEMHWGIDPYGEENYDNVEEWVLMPLTEQNRTGSTPPEEVPLVYERITGTVSTTGTNRITLFIRGLKKFPTGTEVNFDVDDVSLVGPRPGGPVVVIEPDVPPVAEPPEVPQTGAVLSQSASVGVIAFGGLVLVLIGAFATFSLLYDRKKT